MVPGYFASKLFVFYKIDADISGFCFKFAIQLFLRTNEYTFSGEHNFGSMRLLLFSILILLVVFRGFGQEPQTNYFDKDQLILELHSSQWLDIPDDVKLSPRSTAFNVQLMFTLAGKNSQIALASGLGLLTENYHLDALPAKGDSLTFEPIDNELIYTTNKIRFLTVELPLEIRLRSERNSRNKLWKFYVGGKVGYMFQTMHKYNGDDPQYPDSKLRMKIFDLPYTEPLTYGLTARLGYDQVMISAYYSLTNHFQKDKAPELFPLMIGLTLIIY